MAKLYDLIIIGAGPAGITAAVYAARKRMDFIVLTGDIGGQTAWSGDVENYTGYQFITGADLTQKFEEHMKKYDVEVRENELVKRLEKEDGHIKARTEKGEYHAKTVIVASGKKSKELGVPGESEFKNRGLTYCATCDGPLFAGKDVVVVGGGNSALDAALQLINIATHVHIININPWLEGDPVMSEKVETADNVTIHNDSRVTAVVGDGFVTGIKVKKADKEEVIPVKGVFVEIGLIPNSEFAPDLKRNAKGEIIVNCANDTNIPGIFASGDVTDVPEKQIVIAAGDGAKAALGAFRYISKASPDEANW